MQLLSLFALEAIIAISHVYAQEPVAEVWAYSTKACGSDAFSSSFAFTMFETNTVLTGKEWTCVYNQNNLPGFENSGAYYTIFVDQDTIPEGCQLVLYEGPPKGEEINTGPCQTFYALIQHGGSCIETRIASEFGYALCCGNDCEAAAAPPPGLQQRSPKVEVRHAAMNRPAPRDVAALKRRTPLDTRQADCTFSGSGNSVTTFGQQVKLAPAVGCDSATNSCSPGVEVTYTSSTSQTFGVELEIGAELSEIISASVSFTYEITKETSKSFSWTVSAEIPPGQRGFYSFAPRYECTPEGSFSGSDCKGAPVDVPGRVCYQALVSGNPDGEVRFVQDL